MTARADSKGRRTKMAKFKAGDVVEIISGLNKGERGTVGSPNAGTENGKTLVSVYGDVKYIVPEDSLRLVNSRTPRSSNAVVRNALAAVATMNATVDVSKIEADVNAWIAAIRQAAKAKRQAHEIGKRIIKVAGRREIQDNPGLESVLKKANSVYDDASYVKTSQSDFATVFAY